jgi:hypothetical protein
MKCFKRAIVSCALVATMVAPARAAVGITFAAPLAVVAGVAAMGVSAGAAYGGYRLIKQGKTAIGVGVMILSAGGGYFGFLLLDGQQSAKFSELSAEGAADLGISATDLEIYNSEVEQVNAIAREIGSELAAQNSDSADLARDLWMEYGTQLAPETMKTVIAIAQQGL